MITLSVSIHIVYNCEAWTNLYLGDFYWKSFRLNLDIVSLLALLYPIVITDTSPCMEWFDRAQRHLNFSSLKIFPQKFRLMHLVPLWDVTFWIPSQKHFGYFCHQDVNVSHGNPCWLSWLVSAAARVILTSFYQVIRHNNNTAHRDKTTRWQNFGYFRLMIYPYKYLPLFCALHVPPIYTIIKFNCMCFLLNHF